ncbi:MAG: YigZ family protein [Cyclobacteriaceae bacterium]|nr:YigZ family protein [Cyclobacteriaceae bacterium]
MNDGYLTIRQSATGIYKEKGSKFLSFAFPVNQEREALDLVDRLKKEYYDARHHCYAWVLGRDGQIYRTHDAGEPRHTAGDPILNQIRSRGLSDIMVVVVRYFGGTRLGKSGLINAYKKATDDVLEKVEPVEKFLYKKVRIHFRYAGMNDIMRLIDQNNLPIIGQSYESDASVVISVRESDLERIQEYFAVSPHIFEVRILPG